MKFPSEDFPDLNLVDRLTHMNGLDRDDEVDVKSGRVEKSDIFLEASEKENYGNRKRKVQLIEKVEHTRGCLENSEKPSSSLEKLGSISEKTYASEEKIDVADLWNVTSSKPENVKDLEEGELADTDDGEKEEQVVHDNRKVESSIRKEEMIRLDEDFGEGEIVDSDEEVLAVHAGRDMEACDEAQVFLEKIFFGEKNKE